MSTMLERKVLTDIATIANLDPENIEATDVLRDLGIDHFGFIALAGSLRSCIRFFNPEATLLTPEVEASGLTVGGLIALVKQRSGKN